MAEPSQVFGSVALRFLAQVEFAARAPAAFPELAVWAGVSAHGALSLAKALIGCLSVADHDNPCALPRTCLNLAQGGQHAR